ncbi:MAG: zinc ribbon domain-containing protein [Thermoprotei archaeon]|jgi:hypothetical protein
MSNQGQQKRYCPYCGHELPPDQLWYCPYCGSSLRGTSFSQTSEASKPATTERPKGVIIVAVLSIISGVLSLVFGALMFAVRLLLTPSLLDQLNAQLLVTYGIKLTYSEVMTYSVYMGSAFLFMAVLMLGSAAGLMAMKKWGLVLSLIVALLFMVSSILYVIVLLNMLALAVLVLSVAVFIYLIKHRQAFR